MPATPKHETDNHLGAIRSDLAKLKEVVGTLASEGQEASAAAIRQAGRLEGQILRNPIPAVLLASAAGFLLGLIRRR